MISVLDHLNQSKDKTMRSIWISLREEPVIYVNDRPFVLRTLDNLFANIEYTGINTSRVENMEVRLKDDVLKDADKYDGRFLVHDEGSDGSLIASFEKVTPKKVLTPREVYDELNSKGHQVTYHRVAVTDEQAPEEKDFDDIKKKIEDGKREDADIHIILNCQMGRGRTTTAMVIATLLVSRQDSEIESTESNLSGFEGGEYKVILRLIRVLRKGQERKNETDWCIDQNSQFQNLREDIYQWKVKSEDDKLSDKARQAAFVRGVGYLKRYFYLIAFTAFIMEERESGKTDGQFTEWMRNHQELYTLLDSLDMS